MALLGSRDAAAKLQDRAEEKTSWMSWGGTSFGTTGSTLGPSSPARPRDGASVMSPMYNGSFASTSSPYSAGAASPPRAGQHFLRGLEAKEPPLLPPQPSTPSSCRLSPQQQQQPQLRTAFATSSPARWRPEPGTSPRHRCAEVDEAVLGDAGLIARVQELVAESSEMVERRTQSEACIESLREAWKVTLDARQRYAIMCRELQVESEASRRAAAAEEESMRAQEKRLVASEEVAAQREEDLRREAMEEIRHWESVAQQERRSAEQSWEEHESLVVQLKANNHGPELQRTRDELHRANQRVIEMEKKLLDDQQQAQQKAWQADTELKEAFRMRQDSRWTDIDQLAEVREELERVQQRLEQAQQRLEQVEQENRDLRRRLQEGSEPTPPLRRRSSLATKIQEASEAHALVLDLWGELLPGSNDDIVKRVNEQQKHAVAHLKEAYALHVDIVKDQVAQARVHRRGSSSRIAFDAEDAANHEAIRERLPTIIKELKASEKEFESLHFLSLTNHPKIERDSLGRPNWDQEVVLGHIQRMRDFLLKELAELSSPRVVSSLVDGLPATVLDALVDVYDGNHDHDQVVHEEELLIPWLHTNEHRKVLQWVLHHSEISVSHRLRPEAPRVGRGTTFSTASAVRSRLGTNASLAASLAASEARSLGGGDVSHFRLQAEMDSLSDNVRQAILSIDDKERQGENGWNSMVWQGGHTLLHWAAKNNKPMLCKKFLQLGADLYLRDETEGKTALEYAETSRSSEALEVLREAAAAGGKAPERWPWLAPPPFSSAERARLHRGRTRSRTASSYVSG